SIVMAALMRKLMADREDIWTFGGVVVIAANAGGAWSPIGDVTTIMLWNGGQVSSANIIVKLLLPSLVCLVLPLLWLARTLQGEVKRPPVDPDDEAGLSAFERMSVFVIGLVTLLGVPAF